MADRPLLDPYAVLGVPRSATPLQIARAHRRLAKRHHVTVLCHRNPDRGMRRINEAYRLLSSELRRAEYDRAHPSAGTPASGHWAGTRRPIHPAQPTTTRTWASWRTTHRFGQGQVTYVGTLPDHAFGRAIAGIVLQQAGVRFRWASLPRSVRVTGATTREGRRLWFVGNWAWEPVPVPTPVAGVALLSGRGGRKGGSVELGAWDVEIVAEA